MDFQLDIEGKVKNTRLPKSKPLLPVFEAIVNSIHAIEEANNSSGEILVKVLRENNQISLINDDDGVSPVVGFEILDNGAGFNENNFKSFLTSDTTYKSSKGSRGIGRFTWLKAFSEVEVESVYTLENTKFKREFSFTVQGIKQSNFSEITDSDDEVSQGTRVRLFGIKKPFSENVPQDEEKIARFILEHCLSYFILGSAPIIKIVSSIPFNQEIILNTYLTECTQSSSSTFDFEINGKNFQLNSLRFYKGQNNINTVSYCANHREVISEKIASKYILDLEDNKKIKDLEGNSFNYFACVSSPYLDGNVDSSRTSFFIDDKPSDFMAGMGEVSMSEIRDNVSSIISSDLSSILSEIKEEKEIRIRQYVNNEAPSYRPMLKHKPDVISTIPPSATGKVLEIELHKRMNDYEIELREQGNEIINTPIEHFHEYPEYAQKYHHFIEQYNDLGKSKLADYVVHRKIILDLLEKSLQKRSDDKYYLEEDIHELIYPMRSTSDEVGFNRQNLWIIDERLSYHRVLASDKPLNDLENLNVDSDKRPDLLIFNNPIALIEDGNQPYSSVVIVEFKRPMRNSYSGGENPFSQVNNYIRKIKSGRYTDKNGMLVTISPSIPFYVYIICDLTSKVVEFAEAGGYQQTPDLQGYFFFNRNYNAYIEVISFTKLLSDAKKRNKILFENLNI